MNKYLFILGLVGAAVLTACSSDDLTPVLSPEEERALVVEAGMDSDIPITLGSKGSRKSGMTRTPIESDANDLFATPYDEDHPDPAEGISQYLGVSCLARGKQSDAPSFIGDDVRWSADYATSYPYANWMTNKPARVKNDGTVEFRNEDDLSAEKKWYYPFGNWYQYDFYAYYPRQASVSTIAKSSSVIINIDGRQDIIWGKASSDDVVDGVKAYSSKYLRLTGNVPQFAFEHKLTQFVFYVKPHSGSVTQLQTDGIKVTDMKMKEVYKKLKLIIASKDGNLTEGNISELSEYGDVKLWNGDTDAFNGGAKPVVPASYNSLDESTHKTYIGYAMVPPSALITGKGHSQFKVYILLKDNTNATYKEITKVLVPPSNGDEPDGFLAGHKYEIVLEIY